MTSVTVKTKKKDLWREFLIRIHEIRGVTFLFIVLVSIGTIILRRFYGLSFTHAFYEALALIIFSSSLPFPENNIWLQIIWIIYPLIGLFGLVNALSSIPTIIKLGDTTSIEWNLAVSRTMKDHIIIVGLGNVGLRVIEYLVQKDYTFVAIDKFTGDTDLIELYQKRYKFPIIKGNAELSDVLLEANVTQAKAILCLIDNDMLDLKIALLSKKLNPKIKTIIRMFDVEFGELIQEKFDIDIVISTTKEAAPRFIEAIKD